MSCWLTPTHVKCKFLRPSLLLLAAGEGAPPDDSAAVGVGSSGGGGALPSVLQVAKDAGAGILNTDGLAVGGAISANEL